MGMTVEEYRKRMMDAFHNADCEELIALVVSPTEKEFRHLEWLLKTHYKTPKKKQYETRLKADKVAMLTDLQLEIEEEAWIQSYKSNYEKEEEAHTISNMIQSRIDKLKENKNESV